MQNIVSFLRQNDKYLILTHRHPDGDTLGSAAALCAGLRALGKTAYLWRNPEVTERYMPYAQPYFAPEGYAYQTTVAVDTADASLLGEGWAGTVHLRIDHHPSEGGFAELEYTDPAAAACGEVVYTLLTLLGAPLTREIAETLYIAVTTDTGGFRYANTTAATHRLAAVLMDTGIDAHALERAMFSKTRSRVAVECVILSGMEYRAGGLLVLGALTLAERRSAGATEDDLVNIAGLAQSIEGVKIGLLLREEPNGWRVSCRTAEPYAANLICGVLGGGGHNRAAGAHIEERIATREVRRRVLNALWEIYPELRD
ncbi:MAG: DHH family phosphoesterase [Oscillospiraceae bacterium]|nr:DHH family phosphoesterase [Oscillospiraceae bacterium]